MGCIMGKRERVVGLLATLTGMDRKETQSRAWQRRRAVETKKRTKTSCTAVLATAWRYRSPPQPLDSSASRPVLPIVAPES